MSFRNIRPSEDPTAFDVSYEKRFSKQLLADNRRLRRSAENKRVLPIADLLTGIEPLLLDIANLPEKPAEDDVRSIKELIQKQEVVAVLQFYSAKASGRNYCGHSQARLTVERHVERGGDHAACRFGKRGSSGGCA
jgi:hypothetical protein